MIRPISFKVKLIIRALLLALLPMVVLLIVQLTYMRESMIQESRERMKSNLELRSDQAERMLEQALVGYRHFSESITLHELLGDADLSDEACYQAMTEYFAQSLQESRGLFTQVLYVNSSGELLISSDQSGNERASDASGDFQFHPAFVYARQQRLESDEKDAISITPVLNEAGQRSGDLWIVRELTSKVEGRSGFLMVNMSQLPVVKMLGLGVEEEFALISSMGNIMYDCCEIYPSEHVLVQSQPYSSELMLSEISDVVVEPEDMPGYLQGHHRIRPRGYGSLYWIVMYRQPMSSVVHYANLGAKILISVTLLIVVALVIMMLVVINHAMHPLKRLVGAANQVAKGSWDFELPTCQANDEIGVLTRAFASMSDQIHQSYEALQSTIDELQSSQSELRENRQLLQAVIDNAQSMIFVKDLNGKYMLLRTPAGDGQTLLESGDLTDAQLYPEDIADQLIKHDQKVIQTRQGHQTEDWIHSRDGLRLYYTARFPMFDENGHMYGVGGVAMDITERKHAEQRMEQLNRQLIYSARHDDLTGLANRKMLMEQVKNVLEEDTEQWDVCPAFLFMDLNHFKGINDSLGHLVGDQLMVAVANRMIQAMGQEAVVARIAGDEFAVLLQHTKSTEEVMQLVDTIHSLFDQSFQVEQYDIFSSVSMGILTDLTQYQKSEDLLRDADTAMYHAKSAHQPYALFDQAMHQLAISKHEMVRDLRQAIQSQQLLLHMQPIVDISDGKIIACEMLVRWRHPIRGLIYPAVFIDLCAENGMALEMGSWVLHESMRIMSNMLKRGLVLDEFQMSINASAAQLEHGHLPAEVEKWIKHFDIPPERIRIEVTEDAIQHQRTTAIEALHALKALGVSLYIDDFGTGYSSLSRLADMPFDGIKIDKMFLKGLENNEVRRGIINSIYDMARHLKLKVIVEGVEHEAVLELLSDMGIRHIQGYYYSEPVDYEYFEVLMGRGYVSGSNVIRS